MKKIFRIIFIIAILIEAVGMFGFLPIVQDFTWLGLFATFVFAWVMLELFQFSFRVWIFVFFLLILDVFSALLGLYSRIINWDKLMHLCGGIMIAVAVLEIIMRVLEKEIVRVKHLKIFIIINTFFAVSLLGFLYEFLEYLVDKIQYGYPKTLVNVYNSIEDQLCNLLGATLVLVVYYTWQKRKNNLVVEKK
jgi:FlaA1/EpsC-like NDP-sugar epimerase